MSIRTGESCGQNIQLMGVTLGHLMNIKVENILGSRNQIRFSDVNRVFQAQLYHPPNPYTRGCDR